MPLNWIARATPADYPWSSVAWSPQLKLFAACCQANGTDNQIMTSPNGKDWTIRSIAPWHQLNLFDICWSEPLGMFCAVGELWVGGTRNILTSTDGITWNGQVAPSARVWHGINWVSFLSIFVAVATTGVDAGKAMTSPDGINWTPRNVPVLGQQWQRVNYSVPLGQVMSQSFTGGANQFMISLDGINWLASADVGPYNWVDGVYAITPINLWVMLSTSNIATGAGAGFTDQGSPGAGTWRAITYSPEQKIFIIAGDNGILRASINGINWTVETPPIAGGFWAKVIWAKELNMFVVIASAGVNGFKVLTTEFSSGPTQKYLGSKPKMRFR